ncbi:MAG: GAF domain-containing protein [Cyanobacteria bacterium SID2]|nr:GAF domain-containing protein [Cyanobacteria bacterium SID2]
MKDPTSDLTQTDLEYTEQPIEYIDRIQPHGVLVAIDESSQTIVQASSNVDRFFGMSAESLVGQSIDRLLTPSQHQHLTQTLPDLTLHSTCLLDLEIGHENECREYSTHIHRSPDNLLVLEFEPNENSRSRKFSQVYRHVRSISTKLRQTQTIAELCRSTVEAVRHLTGFDRVMVYQFDSDSHGCVIAEAKHPDLQPYLGLHYPDTDTRTCRHLFGVNYSRWIPDVRLESVPLVPANNPYTGQPLNLTGSCLRGVVSCHRIYLENMGARSTLVISLTQQKRLWGLISCHHRTPTQIDLEVRDVCECLASVVSAELSVREDLSEDNDRRSSQMKLSHLVEAMSAAKDWVGGAIDNPDALLETIGASGAAICLHGTCHVLGKTPSLEQIHALLKSIEPHFQQDVFVRDRLWTEFPEAEAFREVASGVLAVALSQQLGHYLLWFRPEVVQTVRWAGNPQDAIQETGEGISRLSPRQSFAEWCELVRGKSLPWEARTIEAALALRDAILKIVLRQVEELAKLMRELKRSNAELEQFVYIASHDLQEPLNLVSSYVQLLEMRYGNRLDGDAKEFIDFAVQGVTHMQRLIDDLLTYSRVGSRGKPFAPINTSIALEQAQINLQSRIRDSEAVITGESLPVVMGDEIQLTQLFQNLIGNAIKFRSHRPLSIRVNVREDRDSWVFSVRDNGIGIDPQFAKRIFVIFQRLHTRDEYPGTGIGLAICQRIVERHGGRIWVVSQPNEGATFYFSLPKP